jgi:hypothetical protein
MFPLLYSRSQTYGKHCGTISNCFVVTLNPRVGHPAHGSPVRQVRTGAGAAETVETAEKAETASTMSARIYFIVEILENRMKMNHLQDTLSLKEHH